jgi:hypothetical protein
MVSSQSLRVVVDTADRGGSHIKMGNVMSEGRVTLSSARQMQARMTVAAPHHPLFSALKPLSHSQLVPRQCTLWGHRTLHTVAWVPHQTKPLYLPTYLPEQVKVAPQVVQRRQELQVQLWQRKDAIACNSWVASW